MRFWGVPVDREAQASRLAQRLTEIEQADKEARRYRDPREDEPDFTAEEPACIHLLPEPRRRYWRMVKNDFGLVPRWAVTSTQVLRDEVNMHLAAAMLEFAAALRGGLK